MSTITDDEIDAVVSLYSLADIVLHCMYSGESLHDHFDENTLEMALEDLASAFPECNLESSYSRFKASGNTIYA